jgi:nitrogen fixation protein NifU and related proteins
MIPEPKLSDLYQEVILDHNKRPRNFKEIENPTHYAHGYNALCGDDYHLYLVVDAQGVIQDVGFKGQGCAISKASASILTTLIKGKSLEEAKTLASTFIDFLVKENPAGMKSKVGRLSIFEGVREFPVRVKCATLSSHALQDAAGER